MITVASGKRVVEREEPDGENYGEVEIYLPSSVEELQAHVLKGAKDKTVRVFYEGTVADWKKIKKGTREETTVKHDWYGYYYHNVPLECTYKEEYSNWTDGKDVVIVCCDGTIQDDERENKSNPAHVSKYSYWD